MYKIALPISRYTATLGPVITWEEIRPTFYQFKK
jgi:hypothetical protein